jgi:hypothetical protein
MGYPVSRQRQLNSIVANATRASLLTIPWIEIHV